MNLTKSLLTITLSLSILSCNDTAKKPTTNSNTTTTTTTTVEKVDNIQTPKKTELAFLNDITSLEKNTKTPIKNLIKQAEVKASKIISINKGNITESYVVAESYEHALVIVGNHTAVKIINFNDCKPSASWAACMPMAEGYIKRNSVLNHKTDYLNNIIGLPDTQERTLYLFN